MTTNTSAYARIAERTAAAGAYSADRYGPAAWSTAAAELLRIYSDEATVEAIMMSKHMRYAADSFSASDEQITGCEIVAFIAAYPAHFTRDRLTELVTG